MADASTGPAPLRGIRVVDLTTTFMGPYCTMQMARMGADVVKVESPAGDTTRGINDIDGNGLGPIFLASNIGKRSVAVDLKHERGRRALRQLLPTADVLVHNMRPRAAASLGLTAEVVHAVNARCVYASLTGFGAGGPYENDAAYDDVIQAVSGLAGIQGEAAPTYVRSPIADKTVALVALSAITAALLERSRTGTGTTIEVPMFESMVSFNLLEAQGGWVYDPPRGPTGYSRMTTPHRRPYRTADGYLAVVVYTDRMWQSFFELIGEQDAARDDRFRTITGRTEHIDELYHLVGPALAQKPSAYWSRELAARGIPVTPVHSVEDLFDDEHLRAVGMFESVEHPVAGRLRLPRHPVAFGGAYPRASAPAPLLGEHSRAVLREPRQPSGSSPEPELDAVERS